MSLMPMTPEEGAAIVQRHLKGELSLADAAAQLLAVTENGGGFNQSVVGMSRRDRRRVAALFRAATLLAGEKPGGTG